MLLEDGTYKLAHATGVDRSEGLVGRGEQGLERRLQGPLRVVRSDWLKLDLSTLPSPATVVSNLPYSVAAPILQTLLDWPGWGLAVLMFQKEVAERILAGPGSKTYGPLTLSVLLKAEASPVCAAPKDCFSPMPKVDSAVVRLRRLPRARLPEGLGEEEFFRTVRAAFQHRRKTAAKSVSMALGLDRPSLEAAFDACGLVSRCRAEDIPFEGFVRLALRLQATQSAF